MLCKRIVSPLRQALPRILFASLLTLSLAILMSNLAPAADPAARDRFTDELFLSTSGNSLKFRQLAPAKLEAGKKYPLVIFLHGAGERGSDNKKQLIHGVTELAADEMRARYPAFVIAPQCPEGKKWVEIDWSADSHTMPAEPSQPLAAVFELVDTLLKTQPIDAQRIYITGLSMGGYGTWDAIQRRPDMFAAAVPVCGGGDPALAKQIQFTPLWAFHGDQDQAVKVKRSREMIEALKGVGAEPLYTEYKGVGHDSWTETYKNPKLYEWLFAQRRE